MKQTKKQMGIWLDFREAMIIEASKNEPKLVTTIPSEIEEFHISGGAPGKNKWGFGETVPEKKYLERRKHQEANYYDRIMKEVAHAGELFIFGPAEAREGLRSKIRNSKNFQPFIRKVQAADQMTLNQKKAMVRDFYNEVV